MTVYLGLGSNLGDRKAHLDAALKALTPDGVSTFIETPALLAPGDTTAQPAYLNAVCALETMLTPRELMLWLRDLELEAGREKDRARWQPRPLDLDILLFGDLVIDEPDLKVPHPEMHKRRFVLEPLAELAPNARHPVLDLTVAELLARV